MHRLIQGDVLEVLPSLPDFACCFMDPPDALGLNHNGYCERPRDGYMDWLANVLTKTIPHCGITWLSYNIHWDLAVKHWAHDYGSIHHDIEIRPFVWTYTFGQNCQNRLRARTPAHVALSTQQGASLPRSNPRAVMAGP